MAVVSRISKLRLELAASAVTFREWLATAAVQDTPAGSSVVVTTTMTTGGATPPADSDTLTLTFTDDAGTTIRSVVLLNGQASQTTTFFFTANGLSGGGNRSGTVEMKLRATKTTGGPTATYDVETDTTPNTPPSLHISILDRGWIRGSTTATVALSNISAGGGENLPYAFGDTMFHRITLGAQPFLTRTFTHTFGPLTDTTASAATAIDKTFSGIVDKRFNAALESRVASCSVQNSTLTGLPSIALTVTDDSVNVDPRVTLTHLMQMDDGEFGTPPLVKNDADGQRLSSQLAYLAGHARHARGTLVGNVLTGGVNGLVFHREIRSQVDPTIFISGDSTTATRGGELGWGGVFTAWSSALPGGVWRKTVTVTDATQQNTLTTAYLVGATIDYTLIAIDPRVGIQGEIATATVGKHFVAGDVLKVAAYVMNLSIGTRENIDASSCKVGLVRYNPVIERMQYLSSDSDPTDAAWTTWNPADPIPYFNMTVSVADSKLFLKSFTQTSGWSTFYMRAIFKAAISGTPYAGFTPIDMLGAANSHDGNAFDPTGLFK